VAPQYVVNLATPEDQGLLFTYLKNTLEASPAYSSLTLDPGMALESIRMRLVTKLEDGCTLIAFHGEKPVGALSGAKTDLPFSKDKIATEFLFYVEPGHPKAAYKLLEAYAYWARKVGCKVLSVGTFEHKEHFIRKGFRKAEAVYLKEIH